MKRRHNWGDTKAVRKIQADKHDSFSNSILLSARLLENKDVEWGTWSAKLQPDIDVRTFENSLQNWDIARAVLHCFIGKSYHTQVRHTITPSPWRCCIVQKWAYQEFKQKLSIMLPPLMLFHYSTLRWVDWQLLQPMRAFYSGHPASVHSIVNNISYSADSNSTQLSMNGSPMLLEVFLLSYPVFHCLLT